MARPSPQLHPLRRFATPAVAAVLLGFSMLPSRYLGWVRDLYYLADTAVTPISHPLGWIARWLAPAARVDTDEDVAQARAEAEAWRLRYLQSQQDNTRLRAINADLQRGSSLDTSVPVRLLARPVVRTSSDPSSGALTVRITPDDGVTPQSTVATTRGLELVGRVISAGGATCTVLPITDPAGRALIKARIIVDDASEASIECLIQPSGGGNLEGPATVLAPTAESPRPPAPEPGMTVRLSDDDAWPSSAHLLIIGTVTDVRPDPDQPLRPIVTVRPRIDLRRVGEVILRIPDERPTPASSERRRP